MYAWRRANVAALNHLARDAWRRPAASHGPELDAPGGRRYAAGDRIVTLAPGADGAIVTSERGTVAAVDPDRGELIVRMDDGRHQPFAAEDYDRQRPARLTATPSPCTAPKAPPSTPPTASTTAAAESSPTSP